MLKQRLGIWTFKNGLGSFVIVCAEQRQHRWRGRKASWAHTSAETGDNILFEGPAERRAEGAEEEAKMMLKENKSKAELLSSFSSSLASVIHLGQLLTRLGLKFTSTMT